MNSLSETALAFVEMAHRIVWCSAATVDTHMRPRSRVLHPIWRWGSPTSDSYAAIRLDPWRLRVFPGSLFARKGGEVLKWQEGKNYE